MEIVKEMRRCCMEYDEETKPINKAVDLWDKLKPYMGKRLEIYVPSDDSHHYGVLYDLFMKGEDVYARLKQVIIATKVDHKRYKYRSNVQIPLLKKNCNFRVLENSNLSKN